MDDLALVISAVFLGSLFLIAVIKRLAKRYGWMVMPHPERWHTAPTALHGGVGMYLAFVAGLLWIGHDYLDWYGVPSIPPDGTHDLIGLVAGLLCGSFVMFVLGFVDDIQPLRPSTKVLGQILAATFFISAGGLFRVSGVQIIDLALTYFWFICIVNALNLLDNIDGLCSGIAIIGATFIILLAMNGDQSTSWTALAAPISLVFIAAILGFWLYNKSPASIFMGDSGSLFIGFILAALALPSPLNHLGGAGLSEYSKQPIMMTIIPITVLAIPIFDVVFVTISRIRSGQRVSQGGRDHLSHRLIRLGLSEHRAVYFLYMLAVVGGILALVVQQFTYYALPILGVFGLLLVRIGHYLGRSEVAKIGGMREHKAWTALCPALFHKDPTTQVLVDGVNIVICFYTAVLFASQAEFAPTINHALLSTTPVVVISCLIANYLFRLYPKDQPIVNIAIGRIHIAAVFVGSLVGFAGVISTRQFEPRHAAKLFGIFCVLWAVSMVASRASLLGRVLGCNKQSLR